MKIALVAPGRNIKNVAYKSNQKPAMKNLLILLLLNSITCFGEFLTPEDYGYPTRTAPAAIQMAVDSTNECRLLSHAYALNQTVYLNTNDKLIGDPGSSLSYGGDVKMLVLQGNNILCRGFQMTCGGIGTNQYGIYLNNTTTTSYYNISLESLLFKDMASAGIYVHKNIPVNYRVGLNIQGCIFLGCDTAVALDERAEYNYFTNCHASEGGIGFFNRGGNNSWIGGSLTYNAIGLKLVGGENDGHSHIVSATINHNNDAIVSDGVENGYRISSCDIHIGDIKIRNSTGINITGNTIYTDSIIVDNSKAAIKSNDFVNTNMKCKKTGKW